MDVSGQGAPKATTTTTFAIDDAKRLLRFLVLGSESGTYSAAPLEHTAENLEALLRMLKGGRGEEAVGIIKAVSVAGRAAKQAATMSALAVCAQLGDTPTRQSAYSALPAVCRTPTHLFEFVERAEAAAQGSTGWGRARRRAISGWYVHRRPEALAEALTKYRQRNGWSHRDVLRLCHAKPLSKAHELLFMYAVKGIDETRCRYGQAAEAEQAAGEAALCGRVLAYLEAVEAAKALNTAVAVDEEVDSAQSRAAETCAALIAKHKLRREHIPSRLLNESTVWEALLEGMPLTALVRNLGKISSLGMLDTRAADGDANPQAFVRETEICARLGDAAALKSARVHPFSLLLAKATYSMGHGHKGGLEWPVSAEVCEALGTSFELSLAGLPPLPEEAGWCTVAEAVPPPARRRILQAVDVSGSMAWSAVLGSEVINARLGAAALAYITQKRAGPGDTISTVGFGKHVTEIAGLDTARSLDEATAAISELPDGPLDLVLMLDCTGSMGCWIEESKKKLIAITEQISCWFPPDGGEAAGLRVSFVGYRDIGDDGQHVVVKPTSDYQEVLAVVQQQRPSGGGDTPEDIAGAFEQVLRLELREDATKLLVHICDAPCHGKQYHSCDDSYPGGDPEGRDPELLLAEIAGRGIDYCLFDVDGGGHLLSKMNARFQQAYDGAVGRTSLPMGVTALGHDSGRLEETILASVERSACGGGTDCAAPILWATERKLAVDCFVVYTDNETTSGEISAADALRAYRAQSGIEARMAVVALSAGGESVADPEDSGMMDMVGFDAAAPAVLETFIAGHL
jgi:60 kDa SS-A/Ro ribonucleoprotein